MPTTYEIKFLSQWKLAPLTKVNINLGGEYTYDFQSIKKGSSFKLSAINEPNDLGGFTTVAYKVECQFIPVQVITNYIEFLERSRIYDIDSCRFYFGKSQSTSHQFIGTPTSMNMDTVDVKNYSIETLEVETSDENFETAIKITLIASVDMINDAFDYFI